MSKNRDLLSIGHSALDYIIRVPEFPKANFSAPINDMKTFNGGAAANVALVGAKLGLKTSLVSAVGGDFKKSNYYEIMESLDVNTDSLIIVPGETSPTAFVLTISTGELLKNLHQVKCLHKQYPMQRLFI